MISHKHRCIFVHIPKAAGVSIEKVFLDDLSLDYDNRASLILGQNPNKEIGPPRLSHLTAQEYLDYSFISRELYELYFKFSFVRNPYSRVYSFYKYLGFSNIISYEKFVLKYLPKLFYRDKIRYFIKPMYEYLYSPEDKLMVDFVGKIENIEEDFKKVQNIIGINNASLSHLNTSTKFSFKRKAQLVYRIFKKDLNIIFDLSAQSKENIILTYQAKEIIQRLYNKDFEVFNY